MLKDQLPVGILKVDFGLALESENICLDTITTIQTIQNKIKNLTKEVACVVCLDIANRPICSGLLGYGSEISVDMSVKEIAQFALLSNASSIVLIHSHPSKGKIFNDLKPSMQDIELTQKVAGYVLLITKKQEYLWQMIFLTVFIIIRVLLGMLII